MKVSEIMRKEVILIGSGAPVSEVVSLMVKHKVGCVLIISKRDAVGIVTERDILEKVVAPNKDQTILEVDDVMSTPLITIEPDADIQEAVDKLTQNKIKKLPVVKEGKLVGILTLSDIVANAPNYMAEVGALILKPTKIVGG